MVHLMAASIDAITALHAEQAREELIEYYNTVWELDW